MDAAMAQGQGCGRETLLSPLRKVIDTLTNGVLLCAKCHTYLTSFTPENGLPRRPFPR